MCQYQSLYFDNDNYVIYCLQCNCYQVLFGNTLISLQPEDFDLLREMVRLKCAEVNHFYSDELRDISIPTPAAGMYLLLTKSEVGRFLNMLEQADNERKARDLLQLFNA